MVSNPVLVDSAPVLRLLIESARVKLRWPRTRSASSSTAISTKKNGTASRIRSMGTTSDVIRQD
ncbi:hypothetical protein D1872_341900 [compost metagenome]